MAIKTYLVEVCDDVRLVAQEMYSRSHKRCTAGRTRDVQQVAQEMYGWSHKRLWAGHHRDQPIIIQSPRVEKTKAEY